MVSSADKIFLVRLQGKYFYIARVQNSAQLHATLFMSYGTRMSYLVACEVALYIRQHTNWSDALVCHLNGDPVTLENIPVEQYSPQEYDHFEMEQAWHRNIHPSDAVIPDAPDAEFQPHQ